MSAEIIMPKMGDAMTEGKVVRWYKKAGEPVKKGEPLLEIETDKVNLDLEAEQDGTIGDVVVQEGQMAPVGGRLATILGAGEKPAAEGGGAPQRRRGKDKKDSIKHSTGEYGEAMEMKGPRIDRTQAQKTQKTNVVAMPQSETSRRRSSPLARKIASEMGVSLEAVQGSGPQGRIVAKDVKGAGGAPASLPARAAGGGGAQLHDQSIPLSTMRRTIARRLAESTGPIPHFYLTVDFDVTNL